MVDFLILHIDNVIKGIFQIKENLSLVTILFCTDWVCESILLITACSAMVSWLLIKAVLH